MEVKQEDIITKGYVVILNVDWQYFFLSWTSFRGTYFFRWLVYWYFDIEQANVCQWRFDSLVVFFVKRKKENEQFFFRFWYFSKLNRANGYFWGLNNSMNFISISIKLQNVLIKIENLIFTLIRWKMLSILTNITIN